MRFGGVPWSPRSEFLSDNGGACIVAQTRQIAWPLGLKPVDMPGPGTAWRTLRGYVADAKDGDGSNGGRLRPPR